ncbi:MAG: RNA polymerase factor sigma-54 [Bacteroidales bacterium]|nr:RNA polymerase factor sigma-54 [Bacteroidales bacterium]MCF8338990.1 RNA polymerase factor sigma-54 [Bacteroidales bacterium]
MLNQRLQQKLLQKLSPQQILLMKLLQVPSVALEQRIKQEVEENPALEDGDNSEEVESEELTPEDKEAEEQDSEEFDMSDYLEDEEIPAYRLQTQNSSPDEEEKSIPYASGTSFHEMLQSQLGLLSLDDHRMQLAENIIGNIDESGYLHRSLDSMVDDMAFSQNITTTKEELEEVLAIIQEFDPPGVGARDLRECLLLQLERKNDPDENVELAKKILRNHFREFTKKHYEKILKKAGITEAQLKAAKDEILKLNPKPGNALTDTNRSNHYVIPDFIITNDDGELKLQLNSRNAPELKLNRTYLDMLEAYNENKKNQSRQQKEAMMFIKQKIDSAKWFIDAIKQRQHTLYITMKAIMDYQYEYFQTGDEKKLRPMILKNIAEMVDLDISTISRVANSKYVQTPFGTFLLKSFFSESMQKESGETVSTREIKKILKDTIESEDKTKPYTDEYLARLLKEKGYNIARRTVAKYREQLNIPVARLRKEL